MTDVTFSVGVCEDDPAVRRVLRRALTTQAHRITMAHDGSEALRTFAGADLDVIVMDIGLPDADGRDVCQALKSAGQLAPVLFLTALGARHERLSGFGAGGDDYVSKPFDVDELLARIAVLGRRGRQQDRPGSGPALTLDPATHSLHTGSGQVLLSPTEFRMLAAIASRPGEVTRREAVVAAGWPHGAQVSQNTLDSFIRRLRAKLAQAESTVSIETVRGVGFRLS